MTLSRTIITSLTTLFAVLALFCFGDGSIFDFSLTMLFGIIAGSYSSLFIATPIMIWWYKGKRPQFDGADADKQG
jgi:preprotein translocase subunit SecF